MFGETTPLEINQCTCTILFSTTFQHMGTHVPFIFLGVGVIILVGGFNPFEKY